MTLLRLSYVTALVSLLGATALGADEPALAEALKRLEGRWAPTENIRHGEPTPKEVLKNRLTVVKGDAYENLFEGKVDTHGTVKFVGVKDKVYHLDLRAAEGPGKGKVVRCLVEFVGDDGFRLCMAEPDAERPAELASKKGSEPVLRTYKRVKE